MKDWKFDAIYFSLLAAAGIFVAGYLVGSSAARRNQELWDVKRQLMDLSLKMFDPASVPPMPVKIVKED